MHFSGILIGACSFLSIGMFHPIVIKAEYYFSKKIWPFFFVLGTILMAVAVFMESIVLSACLGVIGMSCWWSIYELFEQEKRVQRGWFPENPNRWDKKKK